MRITTLAAAATLVLSTTAAAQNVSYDYDRSRDFSALKTYAWVEPTVAPDDLNHRRIVGAIDAQLAAKGMRPAAPGAKPDVLIAYHARVARDYQVKAYGWGGYRVANRSGSARMEEIAVGALGVEMVEASTGALVWHGVVTKDLDLQASPEQREKNLNKAVEKLLKSYPTTRS